MSKTTTTRSSTTKSAPRATSKSAAITVSKTTSRPAAKPAARTSSKSKSASTSKAKPEAKATDTKVAKTGGTKAAAKRPRNVQTEPDQTSRIKSAAILAARYALEKKATQVKLLDLTGITSMTDYFVIATGDSDRQVKAIAESVIAGMRDDQGIAPWRSEGWDGLRWVLIDFVDFVVHVFQTEARQFYNLERLWADAPSEMIEDEPVVAKKSAPKRTTKAAAKEDSEQTASEQSSESASGVRVISGFTVVKGKG